MALITLQIVKIILLNIFNWFLSTILPIYNKEIFKIAPYPLFMTLIQMILVVPLALLAAWATLGFPKSFSWMKPPKEAILGTTFSSLSYGMMMAAGNFGIFVSGVDFSTLFRSSGIIWQALFAFLFLGEKITYLTIFSIILVLIGILTLTMKFEWSQSEVPSLTQCIVNTLATIFSSLAAIFMKQVLMNLRDSHNYPLLVVLSWRYVIACIPIFLSSLYLEPGAWINISKIISAKFSLYILFGATVSELFQLSNLWLTNVLSVIANNILSQLRFVPILIVSHILYKETEWKLRQVVGAVVLTVGAALYSLPKLLKKRGEFQSPQQIEQQADTIDVLEIHEEDDEEENMKIDFSSEEKNDSFHFDNTK